MTISNAEVNRIKTDALAVMELPADVLERILDMLKHGSVLDVFNAPEALGLSEKKIEPLIRLLTSKIIDREHLRILLECMVAARSQSSKSHDEIELCWTGPPHLEAMARSTDAVLRDLLRRAKREILVVGYRITSGEDTATKLTEAMCRVRDAIIVIDNDKQKSNLAAIDDLFKGMRRPKIYARIKMEKGFYKVHAKIIIIDKREMLLTSANMTHYGLRRNFEMGLRIKGRPAEEARLLVREMISSRYFEEI